MKVAPMSVTLVDKMGTDLSVVNAARVSFSKMSAFEIEPETDKERLSEKDSKLIKFLMTHNHFSPFCHAFLSFRIKAPIFVARQLEKHQVGLSWNEVSRRYVDEEPEFWQPSAWRSRPNGSIKQGSGLQLPQDEEGILWSKLTDFCWESVDLYHEFLHRGVAPEQARMILPLNTMTEWIWSGSLMAFIRVALLRTDGHAQEETRELATMIKQHLMEHFPVSTKAWFET